MIARFTIAIGMLFLCTAFIWPGQLKNIARIEVVYDQSAVYPGNYVELSLLTTFKDSSQVSSLENGAVISFADCLFEMSGSVKIHRKSRKSITLFISDEAFKNPYVDIEVQLRRKKAISWHRKIPIRYDVTQVVHFAGRDGYDPRSATDNGYKKIPLTKRVNIEFIDNTQTLTSNSDPKVKGGNGPNLDIYVSLVDSLEEKIIQVEIKDSTGLRRVKYLKPDVGELEIRTTGGRGGISRYGGKGGNGGNVRVHLRPEAKEYYSQIFIVNNGGEGGELWRPKVDGQQQGPYGDDGDLTILDWTD